MRTAAEWQPIDTNILLRFVKQDDADYALVRSAIERLWVAGDDLFYTSQNLAEFWNTCTRPVEKNGYGLTIAEADTRARLVEKQFGLLDGGRAAHFGWRRLVVENAVWAFRCMMPGLSQRCGFTGFGISSRSTVRDFARYNGHRGYIPQRSRKHP
jgi:hypothetical protein